MSDDGYLDPPPIPEEPEPELEGLDGFVQRHPYLSGFLGFLIAVFGGGLVTGALTSIAGPNTTSFDQLNAVGGFVTLALLIGIPIWGYRRGHSKFLVGFFAMIGVAVVLVGACVALIITLYSTRA